MTIHTPTYGIEVEKVFTQNDGTPYAVNNSYFERLRAQKELPSSSINKIGETAIAVRTPYGEEGLDNSRFLGESATGPISETEGGLNRLATIATQEVNQCIDALAVDNAGILNMSNHPLITVNEATYQEFVAPKPVYGYLREVRGWNHKAGIDAKAQNSPSVGISAEKAIPALNIINGFGAGLIALYANSPFNESALTPQQENRFTLWNSMFSNARFNGDRRLHIPSERPFKNMREYFQWMFPADKPMFFVIPEDEKSEKTASSTLTIEGNPSILEYLQRPEWHGTDMTTGEKKSVTPTIGHLAMHQFLQFTGARVRFDLTNSLSVTEFNNAMQGSSVEIEELFEAYGKYFYIEGRDPGANFADHDLLNRADEDTLRSVLLSATALHVGLIRNSAAAEQFLTKYEWHSLMDLREKAAVAGLQTQHSSINMLQFCREMIAIAEGGLNTNEKWLLSYPKHVLRSEQNGADRAIQLFEKASGSDEERIKQVLQQRLAVKL